MGQLTISDYEKGWQTRNHRQDEEPKIVFELLFISKMKEFASIIGIDIYGYLRINDF